MCVKQAEIHWCAYHFFSINTIATKLVLYLYITITIPRFKIKIAAYDLNTTQIKERHV